jgi:HPt (histidine-containing phosphotransfer) domain-containing protein
MVMGSYDENEASPAGQAPGTASSSQPWTLPETLAVLCERSPEAIVELLDAFLQEIPSHLDEIRCASAAGELPALHRGAHSLKGAAAQLGAATTADLCRAIELESNWEEIRPVLQRIGVELSRLSRQVAEYRKVLAATIGQTQDGDRQPG